MNNMKTELTIISDDLNHGVIDEKQARTLLLGLLGVSGSCSCDVKYVETKKSNKMKVQRIRDVKLPTRGTPQSAGLDFYVPNDVLFGGIDICLKPGDSVVIPSGIKVEVPKGYALIGFNKSGIAVKRHLYVGACVIDEDYQGEVHIHLTNVGKDASYISPGDKIAQFILVPVLYADIEEVDELHKVPTERGTGAFGSTDDKDNLK